MGRNNNFLKGVFLVLIMIAVAIVAWNYKWIYDYYRGVTYQPTSEMSRIREDLKLTDKGEFLFNASQPELSEKEDFNNYCRKGDVGIAVLGCYTKETIYVYNIDDAELRGIRELTSAHELLHAVYARMSDEEKEALKPALTQVYAENQEILEEELVNYAETEKAEELYVRAGTEIANLPESLEKHYGEIFREQDAIVAYYNGYIAVFKNLKAELDSLSGELEGINTQIEQKTAEYERRGTQLNANIISFNSCAEMAGCFGSQEEFNIRRAGLLVEQNNLEILYNEINGLVEAYNAKVQEYNADVLRSERLNTIINSSTKPEEQLKN